MYSRPYESWKPRTKPLRKTSKNLPHVILGTVLVQFLNRRSLVRIAPGALFEASASPNPSGGTGFLRPRSLVDTSRGLILQAVGLHGLLVCRVRKSRCLVGGFSVALCRTRELTLQCSMICECSEALKQFRSTTAAGMGDDCGSLGSEVGFRNPCSHSNWTPGSSVEA